MTGDTPEERGGFFAVLEQDHARIESKLQELLRASEALGAADPEARAALALVSGALDFFATEGARHEEVEERALFPRLRPLPQFKQILSALEFQHRMNREARVELEACADRFVPGQSRELVRLVARFVEMHRGHAIAEERALFPLARSVLTAQVVAELDRELRMRKP